MSIGGSSSIRSLKDVAIVMGLHELAPVGRWATGGRDGRWFERWQLAAYLDIARQTERFDPADYDDPTEA